MKLEIPPLLGLRPEHLSARSQTYRNIKEEIYNDPIGWAANTRSKIQDSLQGKNGIPPIQPRETTTVGGISMYEYLNTLSISLDVEPENQANIQMQRLERLATSIDTLLKIKVSWNAN